MKGILVNARNAVALIILTAAGLWWFAPVVEDPDVGGQVPALAAVGDTASHGAPIVKSAASAALQAQNTLVEERESASPVVEPAVASSHGFGELDSNAFDQLSVSLASQVMEDYRSLDAQWNRPGSGPQGEKTLADAIRELESLSLVKRKEMARQLLAGRQYSTFKAGSGAVNEVRLVRDEAPFRVYNGGKVRGQVVDVLIRVPTSHESIRAVESELMAMRGAKLDEEMKAFNELSDAERKNRCLESASALEAARELRRDQSLPPDERVRRLEPLLGRMLPGQWSFTSEYFVFKK